MHFVCAKNKSISRKTSPEMYELKKESQDKEKSEDCGLRGRLFTVLSSVLVWF